MPGSVVTKGAPVARGRVNSSIVGIWLAHDPANLRVNADGSGAQPAVGNTVKWAKAFAGTNNLTQEGSQACPTYAQLADGLGALKFTVSGGAGQALKTAQSFVPTSGSLTCIMAAAKVGTGVGVTPFFTAGVTDFSTAGSNYAQVRGNHPTANKWNFATAGGAGVDSVSTSGYTTRFDIVSAIRSGVGAAGAQFTKLRVNGTQEDTDTGTAFVVNAGTAFVGAWGAGGTNAVDAYIRGMIIANTALSDGDVANLERWLAEQCQLWYTGIDWVNKRDPVEQVPILLNSLHAMELKTTASPLLIDYDGNDPDGLGTDGASVTENTTLASFYNKAGLAATGNGAQATEANKPTYAKNVILDRHAIALGGNQDYFTVGGLQANLNPQVTGQFHFIIIGRKDATWQQVLLANTNVATEHGFWFDFDDTGHLHMKIVKGGGTTVAEKTHSTVQDIGTTFVAEAKGDGANLSLALGFGAFETVAFSNSLGATTATNAARLGMFPATLAGSFDGMFYRTLLFNKPLTTTLRNLLKDRLYNGLIAKYGL